jgi:hypothetical protein
MVEEKDWIVERILTDRDKYDKNMRCKEFGNDKFTMMGSFENNDYYLLSTAIEHMLICYNQYMYQIKRWLSCTVNLS